MKRITALLLALCLLFGMTAVAEDARYVPGQRSRQLVSDALDAGKVVTGELQLNFDYTSTAYTVEESITLSLLEEQLNEVLEGGSEDQIALLQQTIEVYRAYIDSVEHEATFEQALFDTLNNLHIRIGYGKQADGLRLTAGATLDGADGGEGVSIDAAANVDWDGVSIESELIPGQRVTAKWETLLRLAGLDDETVEAFLSLRDFDLDAALADAQAVVAQIAMSAAPYAQIAMEHASTWNMSVREDVPAQGGNPAAETEITVTFTAKDVYAMLLAMADYMETDENLLPFVEQMVLESGAYTDESGRPVADMQRFFSDLREQLSASEEAFLYTVTLGIGENGLPAYANVVFTGADYVAVISATMAFDEVANALDIALDFSAVSPQGNVGTASLSMTVAVDRDDPVLQDAMSLSMEMNAFDNGKLLYEMVYDVEQQGVLIEDGLPIAETVGQQTIRQPLYLPGGFDVDGADANEPYDEISTSSSYTVTFSLTPDGGEHAVVDTLSVFTSDGDFSLSMPVHAESRYAPDGNGGVTGEANIVLDLADLAWMTGFDIQSLGYAVSVFSEDYDPATTEALDALALEDASIEQMNALTLTLLSAAQQKYAQLLAVLPEQLSSIMPQL